MRSLRKVCTAVVLVHMCSLWGSASFCLLRTRLIFQEATPRLQAEARPVMASRIHPACWSISVPRAVLGRGME